MVLFSNSSFGQTLKQYVSHADEVMLKGNYYEASVYYRKALDISPNNVEVLYKCAESYRLQNNYEKAKTLFQKVYDKDRARTYKDVPLKLAKLYKNTAEYKEAIIYSKKAITINNRNKNSYEYQKSKQEKISSTFARSKYKLYKDVDIQKLNLEVNSYESEFAPYYSGTILYFTSSKDTNAKWVSLYYSTLDKNEWKEAKNIELKTQNNHISNLCKYKDEVYFTQCKEVGKCSIYKGKIKGNKIFDIQKLPKIINEDNTNNTHPFVFETKEGGVLLFASNRDGGYGSLDIWYSKIRNKGFEKPINLGKNINSPDNEITPFYDVNNKILYFSSTWHKGFGGYDIFFAKGENLNSLEKPQNVLRPINSEANDYYYKHFDTVAFLASNRKESYSKSNATCCNDIYILKNYLNTKNPEPTPQLETLNDILPTLYFHNDEPNPKTRDTTTKLNYIDTYYAYKKLQNKYKQEYARGLKGEKRDSAIIIIDDFFEEYVTQGADDLELFASLLINQLDEGQNIELSIRGFASPLAKTDYNVNLTSRRIASLINYFKEYNNGVYQKYINNEASNGARLSFKKIPYGEYTAENSISDKLEDKRNSIYSKSAALERKIEIISVKILKEQKNYAKISLDKEIVDYGQIGDTILSTQFQIQNVGNTVLSIKDIVSPSKAVEYSINLKEIEPNQKAILNVSINTRELVGKNALFINILSNAIEKEKRLSITLERKF